LAAAGLPCYLGRSQKENKMMKQVVSAWLVIIAIASGSTILAQQPELRTWTDVKGRKTEASLVGADDSTATLKKSDGKVYAVKLEQLSVLDRDFVTKYLTQNAPSDREDAGSAKPRHFSNVLVLKIGEQQYEPGTIFKIEPAKDEVIKGDCSLKFKCIRKTGESATPYGMCTVIFAKLETGEGQVSMGRQYNAKVAGDGSISVAPTYAWPAAQKEAQLEFSVKLGTSSPFTTTTKYHGKGHIYFYMDDGEGKPLSNIISIETEIPR
jgi:hypothetical protein